MNKKLIKYLIIIHLITIIFAFYLYNNYYFVADFKNIIIFTLILIFSTNINTIKNDSFKINTYIILPILFPVIAFYGPFWTAFITMLGTSDLIYNKRQFVWYKFIYNRSMLFLTGGISSIIYKYFFIYSNNIVNVLLPFMLSALTYFIINISLIYIAIKLAGEKISVKYFIQLFENIVFSYFTGLLFYYLFLEYNIWAVIFLTGLIYIFKDFVYARIKQIDIEEKLSKKKEEIEYLKLKNLLFRNLSHELKTPLTLIFSSVKLLKTNKDKPVKIEKYADLIEQNGYRLLKVVNNLIDISKINTNSFKLNLQNIDIVKLIEDVIYLVEDYIKNKKRILRFNTDTEKNVIKVDAERLERILLNLISNAVKFTDEGDIISINIQSNKNKYVLISVEDTGIGIKKEKHKSIFKQFNQSDESLSRNHEGSGLGLTIVHLLVKMHNGKIELESTPGKGSKFIIKLPDTTLAKHEENNYQLEKVEQLNKVEIEFSDIS